MKKSLVKAALVYGMAWLACLVIYWGCLAAGAPGGGGIMGYVLLALYCILPVAGIVSAFLVGRTAELGWRRLFAPVVIAALYVLHSVATFDLSNALGLTNIAPAFLASLLYGLVPAAVGLVVGSLTALRSAPE